MAPLSTSIQSAILQNLSNHYQQISNIQFQPIGGGSINETYRINLDQQAVFCKVNSATKFSDLFIKEQNGLELIGQQNVIKVPAVVDCLEHDDKQILLLEWIQQGEQTESFWRKFGEQLAALHQQSDKYFGLGEHNYMGSVRQSNREHLAWISFFNEERIQPMITRCFEKHLLTKIHLRQFENLSKKFKDMFEEEKSCLLHGDLWSGNFMCNQYNEPVLIDPAVYYGHRSMDLAMTTLFGGFRQPFYDAYHYHCPFPSNYKEQWGVCNLYPLLIHLYLFGSSYLPQIERTLQQFL